MRVNQENKSVDIERRDVNYILPAYVRLYLFQSQNQDPEKIVFPMYRSVPHPTKPGVEIPIEYIPDDSPVAVEIKEDGQNIPEPSVESEAKADEKEKDYNATKEKIAEMEAEIAKARKDEVAELEPPDQGLSDKDLEAQNLSPARAALAEQRKAAESKPEKPESAIAGESPDQPTAERLATLKTPSIVLPPGTPTDYGGSRDKKDERRIAKDLAPSVDINEDEEIEDKSGVVERAKQGDKEP